LHISGMTELTGPLVCFVVCCVLRAWWSRWLHCQRAVVIDFDHSVDVARCDKEILTAGTPGYTCPELSGISLELPTTAADTWSLGIMLLQSVPTSPLSLIRSFRSSSWKLMESVLAHVDLPALRRGCAAPGSAAPRRSTRPSLLLHPVLDPQRTVPLPPNLSGRRG
jgi:serine/threonine protein kinase